jgi:DNA-binding XRE family transcriptional regulator
MGIVLHFRPRRHARASDLSVAASDSNVMCSQPKSPAKRTMGSHRLAGIPRSRQTLTVGDGNPSAVATLPVPPRSSITESHVMGGTLICGLQTCQGFAFRKATGRRISAEMLVMAKTRTQSIDAVARRLKATRLALEYKKQNEFAKVLGIDKTSYNLMENGKRPVTLDVGLALNKKFGVSLDWLFLGNAAQLPANLVTKLASQAA